MSILADELRKNYEPVDPMDFYRDIFPEGELEEQGEYVDGKYCAIALEICHSEKKCNGQPLVRRYNVTNGLDEIDALLWNNDNFCLMAPISYAGKTRHSVNARFMYALCVEIDNLVVDKKTGEQDGLKDLFHQIENKHHPLPTYVVASGNGLHLYYLWEYPLPMFRNVVKQLKKYKRKLTFSLWNKYITTSYQKEDVQQESIFQAFRMPGTITKNGDRVEVFKTGERVSIEYMNSFVPETYKIGEIERYKSNLPLKKAKELYPEWYESRIVKGEPRKEWICNRGLYDWWKKRIAKEIKSGHRYYALMFLSVYAIKCDISEEELRADCYSFLDYFESLTVKPDNHFTERDVESAIQIFYDKGYITYPRGSISHYSTLHIEPNKRNGRKRMEHLQSDYWIDEETGRPRVNPCKQNRELSLQYMRDNSQIKGRPSAEQKVKEWRKNNPDGKKADCIRELKLDKKTVYKWWEVREIE